MDRWTAFCALIFLLPLPFGLDTPWAWNLAGAVVFSLLALEVNSLLERKKQRQLPTIPVPRALIQSRAPLTLMWGVQLYCIFQWLCWSITPHDSFLSIQKGLTYAGAYTLTLLLVHSRQRLNQLMWIIVISASFQAIYGALMTLSGLEYGFFTEKEKFIGVATGTYLNRNHLAGLLEMSLAVGIGLLLAKPTIYRGDFRHKLRTLIRVVLSNKVILRLLLAVLVIALVLTRSRMGNTAFFASLMIAGALALLLMRNKTTATTILLGSLLVIDITIVGAFFGVDKVAERLQKTSSQTESRDEVTRDTFNIFLDQPITGIGAGTFTHAYPALKSDDITSTAYYNNAHNDYVQFLAEFGLPATAALAFIVIWSFWYGVVAMRVRNSHLYQGTGFTVTMAIVAIGIHSIVDFNLQIPANAMIFVVILALAPIARWTPHSTSGRRRRSARTEK
jgi:O-antigen ligase